MSYPYKVTCASQISLDAEPSNKLAITLLLQGTNIMVNNTIVLTPKTVWKDSELSSLSTKAAIKAQKLTNGTILLSFN
jgi:hypothetical protein